MKLYTELRSGRIPTIWPGDLILSSNLSALAPWKSHPKNVLLTQITIVSVVWELLLKTSNVDMSQTILNLQWRNWYAKAQGFLSVCYLCCDVEFQFPFQYSRAGWHLLVSSFWCFSSDHALSKRENKRPSFHCFLWWLNSPGLSHLGEYIQSLAIDMIRVKKS
jgi:hypothetical protein